MRSSFDRNDDSAGWVKRMWRHRAVNSRNGARIGVHTTGLPSGEPILRLSSLLADWRSWNAVAGRLPSGVYAITMDLRGHGTSSPSAGTYSLAELAADALNVLGNLAFARVHLVGTVVGSLVAHYLDATAGNRTICLPLLGGGFFVPEPPWPNRDNRGGGGRPK